MKIIKFIVLSLSTFLIISCNKHEILYKSIQIEENIAEFQLHYFEPVNNVAINYIDSVYVNNILYSSVLGSGQLLPYNGVPNGATGRFFSVTSGDVNIKLYRKNNIVYDKTVKLKNGKQNIFIHNMTVDPIVIDNGFPYKSGKVTSSAETWNTDSTAMVRFYNFLYEKSGVPYPGKLQYQYQDVRTKEWINIGTPVGFGEATDLTIIKIIKTIINSSGYCRIDYRILDEKGVVLKIMNASNKIVDYSDYWTEYIGRVYMHIFSGIRTAKPISAVKQWTSL